jgi:sugar phosphate isomerase/epimerase
MIAPGTDPLGAAIVEDAAGQGFDYVELSLRDIAGLPEADHRDLRARLEKAGLPCEACNNFYPADIRLTGPRADLGAALGYGRKALERASSLNVRTVVFGSSGARNVPAGYEMESARDQLVALLQGLGPVAEELGIVLSVEPLQRAESNIINRLEEALSLVEAVGHPSVRVLVDSYHLGAEAEDLAAVVRAGAFVRHVHVAEGEGRLFPSRSDALGPLFAALKTIGYAGTCSIEAYTADFKTDARRALGVLRQLAGA